MPAVSFSNIMEPVVYLVGAGPGDPELLTLKGKKILRYADVVIYDALINKRLLNFCKKSAKLIYVGKTPGQKESTQNEINKKLIYHARRKKTVVRLKGGDPFIFGRGGEEAEALVKANIVIEIVPGVSSVSSVPAYSGVPLTHREYNSSFTVITGHENPFKSDPKLNWKAISEQETLIFLMSLKNIHLIMKKLIEEKIPKNTPAMVISQGTIPTQRSVKGTIDSIAGLIRSDPAIKSPAIILVGKIVNLKKQVSWYEKKPLFGKNIVITRAEDQSSAFYDLLSSYGANVIEFPTIETIPTSSWEQVDKTIKSISKFDYVIFTSVNGVKYFFSRIFSKGLDSRIFSEKKIVVIGEKTGSELKSYGLSADIIPHNYTAEGIIESLKPSEIKGRRFLIPRAKVARDTLPKTLKEMKGKVTIASCYETVIPKIKPSLKKEFIDKLRSGGIDLIAFTSSSTVINMLKILDKNSKYLHNTNCASIGPITSDTLISNGFKPEITASKHTIEGLVSEMLKYYAS